MNNAGICQVKNVCLFRLSLEDVRLTGTIHRMCHARSVNAIVSALGVCLPALFRGLPFSLVSVSEFRLTNTPFCLSLSSRACRGQRVPHIRLRDPSVLSSNLFGGKAQTFLHSVSYSLPLVSPGMPGTAGICGLMESSPCFQGVTSPWQGSPLAAQPCMLARS